MKLVGLWGVSVPPPAGAQQAGEQRGTSAARCPRAQGSPSASQRPRAALAPSVLQELPTPPTPREQQLEETGGDQRLAGPEWSWGRPRLQTSLQALPSGALPQEGTPHSPPHPLPSAPHLRTIDQHNNLGVVKQISEQNLIIFQSFYLGSYEDNG